MVLTQLVLVAIYCSNSEVDILLCINMYLCVCMYVCMYVCLYVCLYVCTMCTVCMHQCMYTFNIRTYIHTWF